MKQIFEETNMLVHLWNLKQKLIFMMLQSKIDFVIFGDAFVIGAEK